MTISWQRTVLQGHRYGLIVYNYLFSHPSQLSGPPCQLKYFPINFYLIKFVNLINSFKDLIDFIKGYNNYVYVATVPTKLQLFALFLNCTADNSINFCAPASSHWCSCQKYFPLCAEEWEQKNLGRCNNQYASASGQKLSAHLTSVRPIFFKKSIYWLNNWVSIFV